MSNCGNLVPGLPVMESPEIGALIEEAVSDGWQFVGIRSHHDPDVKIGDEIANSHVWIDGERTDEELPGVSALAVVWCGERINRRGVADDYRGGVIVVVASDHAEWGEDVGEIVLRRGVVLAVIA